MQIYSPVQRSSALSESAMPAHASGASLRAVLWDSCAILLSRDTCLVHNLDTLTWQERKVTYIIGDLYMYA